MNEQNNRPNADLIIVCAKETMPFGEMLKQYISQHNDKEGKIVGCKDGTTALTWSEKNYEDSKPTVSSNQKIIFIGSKLLSWETMNKKYEKFHMKYYSLGSQALLMVDDELLGYAGMIKEKDDFIKYTKSYLSNIHEINYAAKLVTFLPFEKWKAEMRMQRYQCLISVFYHDFLENFLRGE
ncbi:hypothetical protein ACTQ1O_04390 [Bilifractor sp. LCP21S3_A7]|uniref:hypothetical protein n=1 Tax=Bilifractor sp. LCP21S3_A7 TaxID=3438738 RepID=UPI003F8EFD97